jgi:Na+-translocating ferredoxin:NAD+ oxidoreductase subunit G
VSNPKKSNPIAQAWLVIVLAVVYGAGLAFVHTTLSPRIEENKKNETYSLIPVLVGDPVDRKIQEQPFTLENGQKIVLYHVTTQDEKGIGWVIRAETLGFAEKISMLVGVDDGCNKILGMRVIDQKETPGLGNFIVEPEFTGQFSGKSTDSDIEVVKTSRIDGNKVRAVTGATVSSRAVAGGINDAIRIAKPLIQQSITQ